MPNLSNKKKSLDAFGSRSLGSRLFFFFFLRVGMFSATVFFNLFI
jgi:hypothetical protein